MNFKSLLPSFCLSNSNEHEMYFHFHGDIAHSSRETGGSTKVLPLYGICTPEEVPRSPGGQGSIPHGK